MCTFVYWFGDMPAKIILVIANILLLSCSICFLVFGVFGSGMGSTDKMEVLLYLAAIALFIACFVGFWSSRYKNIKCLIGYVVAMLVFVLITFVIIIIIVVKMENEVKQEQNNVRSSFKKYETDPSDLDRIQSWYDCCGLDSYRDFKGKIPISCCPTPEPEICTALEAFKIGCLAAAGNYTRRPNKYIFVFIVSMLLTMVIAAAMAICIIISVRHDLETD